MIDLNPTKHNLKTIFLNLLTGVATLSLLTKSNSGKADLTDCMID